MRPDLQVQSSGGPFCFPMNKIIFHSHRLSSCPSWQLFMTHTFFAFQTSICRASVNPHTAKLHHTGLHISYAQEVAIPNTYIAFHDSLDLDSDSGKIGLISPASKS